MPLLTRTPYMPPSYEEMKDCLIEGTTEAPDEARTYNSFINPAFNNIVFYRALLLDKRD